MRKYNIGDRVMCDIDGEILIGVIKAEDLDTAVGYYSESAYDVLSDDTNVLYKRVYEKQIVRTLGC